jgi:probable rRNA maturation factor
MSKIHFFTADRELKRKDKRKLKSYIEGIFIQENHDLEKLDYIFCSDEYLLDINQRFLNHDTYTDIITFDLSESNAITGEIYISLDRIKENAEKFTSTLEIETLRVIFHGALHLCGYKDKNKKDQQMMRAKEDHYIHQY